LQSCIIYIRIFNFSTSFFLGVKGRIRPADCVSIGYTLTILFKGSLFCINRVVKIIMKCIENKTYPIDILKLDKVKERNQS